MTDEEFYTLIKKLYLLENKTKREIVSELKESYNIDKTLSSICHYIHRNNLTKYKMPKSLLTQEVKNKIFNMYNDGLNCAEMEQIIGIDRRIINDFIRRNNLSTKKSIYKLITENEIKDICEMYNNGLTAKEILKKYNDRIKSENTIIKIIKNQGYNIRSRGIQTDIKNEDFFHNIDSEEKAYLLGFLISDGYIIEENGGRKHSPCIGLTLQEQDKYILEKMKKIIGVSTKLTEYSRLCKNNQVHKEFSLNIRSKQMAEDLKQYGIIPRKTFSIEFPKNINKKFYPHLIRGIFDGDGCISNQLITFYGNENVVNYIKYLLENTLQINKVKTIKRIGCYSFTFSAKKDVKNFYNYIYKDATIYLTRKKEKFEKILINL